MNRNEKIVFGVRPVEELLNSEVAVKKIFFEQGKIETKFLDLKNICIERGISFIEKSFKFISKLSGSENNQGIMAIYTPLERSICFENSSYIPKTKSFLCLYLDGIQDPHNFGAIIRSAEFFGVDQIFYPDHNNSPLTSVAIKSSAGAIIHNPPYKIYSVSDLFNKFIEHNFQIIGTVIEASENIHEINFNKNTVIVIGSEGFGISDKIKKYCNVFATMPSFGKMNSLNASVFSGIILYQAQINRFR